VDYNFGIHLYYSGFLTILFRYKENVPIIKNEWAQKRIQYLKYL